MRVQRGQIERIVFVFSHLGFGVDSDQGPKCEVDGFAQAMQVIPLDHLVDQSLVNLDLDPGQSHDPTLSTWHVANHRIR